MALNISKKKRRCILIKYLLAEETEGEDLIFEMYGRKKAKTRALADPEYIFGGVRNFKIFGGARNFLVNQQLCIC